MWPHAVCLRNHWYLIALLVSSHVAIACAYMVIPTCAVLLYMRSRECDLRSILHRKSVQVRLLILGAAFVILCGADHAIEADTFFEPSYWLDAWWTLATALVSLAAAFQLSLIAYAAFRHVRR